MKNYIFASANKDEFVEALDPAWKGPLPYTLIVDEKGKVIYREMGSIDFLKMRRAIVPALNRLKPWQRPEPDQAEPVQPSQPQSAGLGTDRISVRNGTPVRLLSEPDRRRMCAYPHTRKPRP